MAAIKYILLLIVLTLTTFLNVSKAETCTTNNLGDRTCTTSTAGTTTGNVLTNSTFGTGSSYSTSGWTSSGDIGHGHNGTGGTPQSGQNTSGGVLAFEGDPSGSIYQDVDLVGDGHLTQSQINEGFTSTMSADVWFWNNVENTLTLKQTITAADGTVTTQTRNINDHDPNRNFNGGQWTNYTDSYTHNSNTETDFTIRAEVYNNTAGTNYDGAHYGPDVDNVQLSITTAGEQSTTFTPCQDLGTCTSAGTAINDAVNLTTDDGVDLFTDLDTKVDDAIKDFEEVEVVTIDTTMLIEDDLGEIEEVKFDDFVEMQFTSFLEENNLVEEFKTELKVEGISEEEFFDELGDSMMKEIGGDMMNEIASLDGPETIEEPKMEDFKEEVIEEPKMEEMKEEEIANEPELKQEEIKEESPEQEVKQEEVKEETTETETNANTETTTEAENTSEKPMETSEEGESSNEESNMDENSETEGSETETDNAETMEDKTTGDDKTQTDEIDSVSVKVKKIIEKLEKTLKNVDDKVKAVQFVTLKGIQASGADLSSYNVQLKDTIKLNDGNPDFFNQLNIEQEQIYSNVSLNAYTNNDPISIKQSELKQIDIEKQRLLYEIEKLKKG